MAQVSPFPGELLLFAPGGDPMQREVTKRKHAPTSGSDRLWAIRLPSLRCCSGAGRDGPSMARLCLARPSWPLTPLRNTSTRPPVGDPESELLAGLVVAVAKCPASRRSD